MRDDGRCVYCGGERRYARLKTLYRLAAEVDPFCSTACCKLYHGIEEHKPPGRRASTDVEDVRSAAMDNLGVQ